MTRRSPQNGPRRDTPEGCHAPSTKNEPERPPWNPRRASFVGPEDRKYIENGVGATGGALYNGGTQPGGVAGQGQMGNVGLPVSHGARPGESEGYMRLALIALCTAALFAAPASAAVLSWGQISDLPNGVLGVGDLTAGTTRLFTNPGNEGFDVAVRFSGSFSGGFSQSVPVLGPDSYIWFQSGSSTAQTFAWVEFFFYETGTSKPVDVLGFTTKIEDVERGGTTREYLIGPRIVSNGTTADLSFSDTSIFNLPSGTWGTEVGSKLVDGVWLSRAVPGFGVEGGTQAGKTVDIDLSTTPLSYFRIGQSRYQSSAGSVLMGPIGDIAIVPEPATLSLLCLGGLALIRRHRSA